jgi:hypothetical protein
MRRQKIYHVEHNDSNTNEKNYMFVYCNMYLEKTLEYINRSNNRIKEVNLDVESSQKLTSVCLDIIAVANKLIEAVRLTR